MTRHTGTVLPTAALIAALGTGTITHAQVVTATTLADYNAAAGPSTTLVDTFDGPTSSDANVITTDFGLVSTLANGSMSLPSQFYNHPDFDLSEFGFVLHRTGSVAPRNVIWDLPHGAIGFYGEWVTVTGADVTIVGGDGTVYDISEEITGDPNAQDVNGFWGMVDPTNGIDQVIFSVDPDFGSDLEVYWLTSMGITFPQPPQPEVCVADLNGDGTLNVDDIDAFVAAFLDGCP